MVAICPATLVKIIIQIMKCRLKQILTIKKAMEKLKDLARKDLTARLKCQKENVKNLLHINRSKLMKCERNIFCEDNSKL
jgi:hypothetical protein